ncbi:hypothetical protein PVAND_002597 [Polypedilum vanderplanki]|uniref:G-protein coupled receptors family 1 profile domain-containing protein n=1 Tax=Polypedilum vanderplanki TaxID=319348 RepID=A0A9J6BT23_POLVA|nr:hypothetical protein PVAND_002597 [Polypedilum vanderplanki]
MNSTYVYNQYNENKYFYLENEEYMEPWAYNLTALVLFFIGFFGFFLNLIVIVLMCKDIQMWTPMNIILLNLVCSDFSVSVLGNPFALLSAYHHKWIFGDFFCVAYGFFMSLLGITSITTLTVLAYERCCLVTSPFSSSHLTNRGAKLSVCFIWTYSFLLTSPPLFGWGKYINEAANISCSVNWETQTLNATSYIVFLFIFGLVVPVAIILYSYFKIIMTMKGNALRAGRVNKIETKVTLMIAIMIIAFLIAWTPYSIFALTEQFGDSNLITPALAVLPALIAKSSICYNPCIYVISNSQFRASWRRVFGKEKPNHSVGGNETITNQISESSSRVYIECSFKKFDKKRKSRHKGSGRTTTESIQLIKLNNLEDSKSIENKNNNNKNYYKIKCPITKDLVNNEFRSRVEEIKERNQAKTNDNSRYEIEMIIKENDDKVSTTFSKIIQANSSLRSDMY